MLKNIAPKAGTRSVQNARRLRRAMSLPEVLLWKALRNQPDGLKFRRQHPTGPFILDFFCGDARLAIEVDGEAHDRGDRPLRDKARDDWLRQSGVETLRIPAADVLADAGMVARFVLDEARRRLPLHHPAAPGGPPPRDKLGED